MVRLDRNPWVQIPPGLTAAARQRVLMERRTELLTIFAAAEGPLLKLLTINVNNVRNVWHLFDFVLLESATARTSPRRFTTLPLFP